MGCTTSHFEPSDVVKYCLARKKQVKLAVKCRKEFALAHFAYMQILEDFGLALRQLCLVEGEDEILTSARIPSLTVAAAPSPPVDATDSDASLSSSSALSPPAQSHLSSSLTSPAFPLPGTTPVRRSSPSIHSSQPVSPNLQAQGVSSNIPRQQSLSDMVSPGRTSNFSPPFYSPTRGDSDDYLSTLSTSPPLTSRSSPPLSSPPPSASWFTNPFEPPLIPLHLKEKRRFKTVRQTKEVEQTGEDVSHSEDDNGEEAKKAILHSREEEGMPPLEDEGEKGKIPDMEIGEVLDKVGEYHIQNESALMEQQPRQVVQDEIRELDVADIANTDPDPVVAANSVATEVMQGNNEDTQEYHTVIMALKGLEFLEALRHLHDMFVNASKGCQDVAQMLEIKRVHHLSINGGSPKVFNGITSFWSMKTSPAMLDAYEDGGYILDHGGLQGSHASTLERLYAWEKKLYFEVKEEESIQTEFIQKCKQLHDLHAKGVDDSKTRACLKKLDNRLMVAFKAISSVSGKIQGLANEELFCQLQELLAGLLGMWKVMYECHKGQQAIALEIYLEPSETDWSAIMELEQELERWQQGLQSWVSSHRQYIESLHVWLQLCHVDPYHEVREDWFAGLSPVCSLLSNWHKHVQLTDTTELLHQVIDEMQKLKLIVHRMAIEQSLELGLKKHVGNDREGKFSTNKGYRIKTALFDKSRVEKNFTSYSAFQPPSKTILDQLSQTLPTVFESLANLAKHFVSHLETVYTEHT